MKMVALLFLVLMAAACVSSIDAKAPADFAPIEGVKGDGVVLKAVNAEGVVYRVRTEEAEAKAELAYWKEALANKLKADGYVVLSVKDQSVAGRPGAVIDAVAPLADADYGFTVMITTLEDEILIVEGAGERKAWDKVRPQMALSADAIHLR